MPKKLSASESTITNQRTNAATPGYGGTLGALEAIEVHPAPEGRETE